MANPLLSANVRVIGKDIVDAKLLAAAPRILAQNRAMATQMLGFVKAELIPETPIGPGHFGGRHLRDSYKISVKSEGVKTSGTLSSLPQGYWREKGTRRGERALHLARKALAGVNRFIRFYYGKQQWWRL